MITKRLGLLFLIVTAAACNREQPAPVTSTAPALTPKPVARSATTAAPNVSIFFTGLCTFRHDPPDGNGIARFTSVDIPRVDADRPAKLTANATIPRHHSYLVFETANVTIASNPHGLAAEQDVSDRLQGYTIMALENGEDLSLATAAQAGVGAPYKAVDDPCPGAAPAPDNLYWVPSLSHVSKYSGTFVAVPLFARIHLDGGSLAAYVVDGYDQIFKPSGVVQPIAQLVRWSFRVDSPENRITFVDAQKREFLSFTYKHEPAVFVIGSSSDEDWRGRTWMHHQRDYHFEAFYDTLATKSSATLSIPETTGACKAATLPAEAPVWLSKDAYEQFKQTLKSKRVGAATDKLLLMVGGMDCGPDGQP